jgi:hypothetical protein
MKMSKSNISSDKHSNKPENDSDDWKDLEAEESYYPDMPVKIDRQRYKRNAEARRRYEDLRDDLKLKALLEESWY